MRDKETYPLLDMLQSFREFESSDPKDKVYRLLNLVSPRSEVEALNVDYNKSVGEVYADTVFTVIQLYSRLTTLAYITHPEDYDGKDDYRSWAPRWDDLAVARILGFPEVDCPWSACDKPMVTMTDADHLRPEQLCLRGTVYEKVHEVEEIMDFDNLVDPEHAYGDARKLKDSPMDVDADPESAEMHPLLKVWKTIILDSLPELSKEEFQQRTYSLARTTTAWTVDLVDKYVQDVDADTQNAYYRAFIHVVLRLTRLDYLGDEGEFSHDTDSKKFEADACYTCTQQRIFWTETGFFRLGPQCMQTGDIVVVLYGGNTPYVLRPRGDKYLFMGQAYVDNIMHGQLVHSLRAGRLQKQAFCRI